MRAERVRLVQSPPVAASAPSQPVPVDTLRADRVRLARWQGAVVGGVVGLILGHAAALLAAGGAFREGAVLGSSLAYDRETLQQMERANDELGEIAP